MPTTEEGCVVGLVGGIIIVREVLVGTFAEEVLPLRGAEVGQGCWVRGDCCEPVIEDDMKLGSDGSSVKAQNEGDSGGMLRAHANENLSLRAGLPAWQLLAICDLLVEDVNRTPPHVKVLELRVGPASLGEDSFGI